MQYQGGRPCCYIFDQSVNTALLWSMAGVTLRAKAIPAGLILIKVQLSSLTILPEPEILYPDFAD